MNSVLILICIGILVGQTIRIPLFTSAIITPLDLLIGALVTWYVGKKIITKTTSHASLFRPILLFSSICLISLLINSFSLQQQELLVSFLYFLRWLGYVSIYFIIAETSPMIKKRLPIYIIITACILGIMGIIQFLLYTNLVNLRYLGWDEHWYRLFATFFDPNFIAIFFVMTLFITVYYVQQSFHNTKRLLLYAGATAIQLIALFLTFSRSGFLACIAGLTLFFVINKQSKKLLYVLIGFFVTGIIIILLNYQATEGTKLFRIQSSQHRIVSAQEALTIFQKNPIIGVGFNAYRYAKHRYGLSSDNWQSSHSDAGADNSFLFILATTGIIGACAYLFLLIKTIFVLMQKMQTNDLASAILAAFVALCISSFFVNSLFYPLLMIVLWLLLGAIENTSQ